MKCASILSLFFKNTGDFATLRQYLLGMINEFSYQYGMKAADVNGDGVVNSIDFAFFRQFLLGMIDKFPADA